MRRLALTAPLLAGFAALFLSSSQLTAQVDESDPRFAEDPTEVSDPRTNTDPRDASARSVGQLLDELEGTELLEALWERGSTAELSDAMRDEAWELLGWIDSHCEQWLSLIEAGGMDTDAGQARAAELVDKATRLATLADSALKDSRFSTYVHTFTNWDSEQQLAFRGGQAHYREASQMLASATSAEHALRALSPLERSLAAARPLGDTWGQSMTLAAMGEVHHANKQWQAAREAMRSAVEVGRTIRDLDSVWSGYNVIVEASIAMGEFRAARSTLQEQYQLSVEVGDEESEQRVIDRLVQIEEMITRVEQQR
ncbi:MAG: hypothetical protein DHS20C15_08640 [Planctomycetota bacterium]|nr:MAG: hypothetical protein DHS20C15_08640 [Planctomycetota bacterium]